MAKIFLEISVPGNAKTYEVVADNTMTVGKLKEQVIGQITELENHNLFADSNQALFGCVDLEGLLRSQDTLGDVGVLSGFRLILL